MLHVKQQLHALKEAIDAKDSHSVKSLEAIVLQVRQFAGVVSTCLAAAKQEEELAKEKARKDELAKSIWDKITALTAEYHALQGVVPPIASGLVPEPIVSSAAASVAAPSQTTAVDVGPSPPETMLPPAPKLSETDVVGGGVSGKPATGRVVGAGKMAGRGGSAGKSTAPAAGRGGSAVKSTAPAAGRGGSAGKSTAPAAGRGGGPKKSTASAVGRGAEAVKPDESFAAAVLSGGAAAKTADEPSVAGGSDAAVTIDEDSQMTYVGSPLPYDGETQFVP
jgi:hypothetical protein